MKISNRLSSNHYRAYEKEYGLEFELEMKNRVIKLFQNLLFSNRPKELKN
jgi:hypothetical protein